MKILQLNQKVLILFGLCTHAGSVSFRQKLRYNLSTSTFVICYAYLFLYPTIKFILEKIGDYSEYNWGIYQLCAITQVLLLLITVSVNKAKVREVIDELQKIVDESEYI